MAQSFISNKEQGFTLIELIVALALGLILVAAATQLFIGGLLSSRLQKANAEIRTAVFLVWNIWHVIYGF